jgi:MmgE/PrpD N-terminal domain
MNQAITGDATLGSAGRIPAVDRDAAAVLASHVAAASTLPEASRRAAARLALDTIGAAIAAHDAAGLPGIRRVIQGWGGRPDATVIGTGARVPAHNAGRGRCRGDIAVAVGAGHHLVVVAAPRRDRAAVRRDAVRVRYLVRGALRDRHDAVEHVPHRPEQVGVPDRDPRPAVAQQEVQLLGRGVRADRHHARAGERHGHCDLERKERVAGEENDRGRVRGTKSRQRGAEAARVVLQGGELPEGRSMPGTGHRGRSVFMDTVA